jgi:hypothetical protein
MNFNWLSLPWQVSQSPSVAAVIRHSTFETGWTARQVLGAHPKNNTVGRLLHSFQNQLFRRWQRIPNKVNTLAHFFTVSNMSSFPSSLHRTNLGQSERPIAYILQILIAGGFCFYLHRKCGRTDLSAVNQLHLQSFQI